MFLAMTDPPDPNVELAWQQGLELANLNARQRLELASFHDQWAHYEELHGPQPVERARAWADIMTHWDQEQQNMFACHEAQALALGIQRVPEAYQAAVAREAQQAGHAVRFPEQPRGA